MVATAASVFVTYLKISLTNFSKSFIFVVFGPQKTDRRLMQFLSAVFHIVFSFAIS